MKLKLHLLFFVILFSLGLHAQDASMAVPTIVVAGSTHNATVYHTDAPAGAIVQVKFHLTGDWGGSKTSNWKTIDGPGDGSKTVSLPVPGPVGNYFMELHFMNSGWGRIKQYYYYNIEVVASIPENTFNETTNTDWNTATNWSLGTVPTNTENVIIPAGKTVVVDATTGAVANDLTVNATGSLSVTSGGSLKLSGVSTGDIKYNLAIADTNWHLVSSPVSGEGYDNAWVAANDIASGDETATNRGIATYQNGAADPTTGNWVYMQGGGAGTFGDGVGYSMKSDVASTTYSFTGTYPTFPIAPTITQTGTNHWNLIGNSTPAFLDVTKFISTNTNRLSADAYQALYVYSTAGGYASASGHIHPGQAFFVNSNVASGTVSTTAAMLSHTTTTFYKNNETSIELKISEGDYYRKAYLEYSNNGTLGLDPGKDIGVFNGVSSSFSIFTHLLENNEGIAFERQALPISDFNSMIVPVGLKAAAGKEITISANAANLPEGIKVFLEDRETNTFTRLDGVNSNYKVTLKENINGVGRFYLHTAAKVLSTENISLENVGIFKSNASTITITGLSNGKATLSMYNILGRQVMTTFFESNGVKNISLPKLATGIYIVKLETEAGKLNKKIILE